MRVVSKHEWRVVRCTNEADLYRAICTCGWFITGERPEVEARAETHELDEISEPPLRREGFVSGLPDE